MIVSISFPSGDTARRKFFVVKVAVGRTTGLIRILPYPEHRLILIYPSTMFELDYEDVDLDHICSARHCHVSSFFLHRRRRLGQCRNGQDVQPNATEVPQPCS